MRTSPRRFRKYIAEAATGMSGPVDRVRNKNSKTPIRWTVMGVGGTSDLENGRRCVLDYSVGNGRALGM